MLYGIQRGGRDWEFKAMVMFYDLGGPLGPSSQYNRHLLRTQRTMKLDSSSGSRPLVSCFKFLAGSSLIKKN
jgi:hypothetical protein